MEANDDYYKVLGVSKDASEPDIKTAYRELVNKWHSDKDLGDRDSAETDLKLMAEAHEVLSDPIKREIYDQQGKKGLIKHTDRAAPVVVRLAGESEDESGDDDVDDDVDEVWNYDVGRDDLDELNDMLERFSYGSNYDEDFYDLLNDPNHDEAYSDEGDASSDGGEVEGSQPGGSDGCNGLSVTEQW